MVKKISIAVLSLCMVALIVLGIFATIKAVEFNNRLATEWMVEEK